MTRSVLALVLATLMISSSFAIELKLTHVQEKKMKELQQERWGRILFSMAELHSLAGGAVEDLTAAIEQLVSDIGDRIDELDAEYNDRTLFHQSEVTRIGSDISSAQISVSSTNNLLENIFYPERAKIQFQIASNNDAIAENNAYVEKITFERQTANEAYQARVDEKNAALSAVDECIEIISSISGGNISFAQTKQVNKAMTKVVNSLPKSVDEVMIKALVQLASEQFADQSALLRVLNALGAVKADLQADLQAEHDEELRLVAQYNEDVAGRNRENRNYTKDNLILSGTLKATENRIGQKEAFLAIRTQDLANSHAELDAENAAFEEATEFYHDIRTECEREAAVANDTLTIVLSAGWGNF
jgi:hypothetical protein